MPPTSPSLPPAELNAKLPEMAQSVEVGSPPQNDSPAQRLSGKRRRNKCLASEGIAVHTQYSPVWIQ